MQTTVLLALTWDVKPRNEGDLPTPATSEMQQRTNGQRFIVTLALLNYMWLFVFRLGDVPNVAAVLGGGRRIACCESGLDLIRAREHLLTFFHRQ